MARSRDLIRKFNKVQTYDDLKNLNIGNVFCDISHRGGNVGFASLDVAKYINVANHLLSRKVGAYCNYLGGGMRGSIVGSSYSGEIKSNKREVLDALIDACKRVYKSIEDECHLNDEEYEDGDTNWDAIATKESRKSGVVSAY